jgi:hypothetical protein
MLSRISIFATILILFIQFLFSFYYSSEIINQNNLSYKYQTEYQQLKITNQDFKQRLATFNSINYLSQNLNLTDYSLIKNKF